MLLFIMIVAIVALGVGCMAFGLALGAYLK